jgi:hypothetical protein
MDKNHELSVKEQIVIADAKDRIDLLNGVIIVPRKGGLMPTCKICQRENLSDKELEIHMKYFHGQRTQAATQPQRVSQGVCPDCGSTLFFQEGCVKCQQCGYSKC